MLTNDPAALTVVRRTMVARIATLSRNGRPSINPLYFIEHNGHIWLGTADWTLAARNVAAEPRVSILFAVERHPGAQRILCISGRACVRTDAATQRTYGLHVARKYLLTPGGVGDYLTHLRLLPFLRAYYAQSAQQGSPCVIDVTPEQSEFVCDVEGGQVPASNAHEVPAAGRARRLCANLRRRIRTSMSRERSGDGDRPDILFAL